SGATPNAIDSPRVYARAPRALLAAAADAPVYAVTPDRSWSGPKLSWMRCMNGSGERGPETPARAARCASARCPWTRRPGLCPCLTSYVFIPPATIAWAPVRSPMLGLSAPTPSRGVLFDTPDPRVSRQEHR